MTSDIGEIVRHLEEAVGYAPWFAGAAEAVKRLSAEQDDLLTNLSNPIAVHVNMVRGTIAKPSWENLRHLYPQIYDLEHADRRREAAEARAEAAEARLKEAETAWSVESGGVITSLWLTENSANKIAEHYRRQTAKTEWRVAPYRLVKEPAHG